MGKEFVTVVSGEWIQPVRHGYRMKCCDCGLIHRFDFRIVKRKGKKRRIQFRAFREQTDQETMLASKS